MRIGVYVDGFNLYYGARDLCGRGKSGWRWLDLEALANDLIQRHQAWAGGATLERLIYCTAAISGYDNPVGHQEQDVYLKALRANGSVTRIEYGQYVTRVKKAPLAVEGKNKKPRLVRSSRWPVKVQDKNQKNVPNAVFMVSYARREEKASDVNVASHLLIDTLDKNIEAAIVICNDSDLNFPLREARKRISVGLVNPSPGPLAGRLRGKPTDGVGGHWWLQLTAADIQAHQLPDPCGKYAKPGPW